MKNILLATVVAATLAAPAFAELRINGFANLVAGKSNKDTGVMGYDDNIDFSQQSNFAIQFDADINDDVTATAQLIARGENDYDVDMEWAYLTYQVNNELAVSAGRLRMPLFMYSASLDVGYSYHWITAPESVYSVPFDRIDGTQVTYTSYNKYFDYSLQAAFGSSDTTIESDDQQSHIQNDNAIALVGQISKDNLTLRGVVARADGTFKISSIEPAIDALAALDPSLGDLLAVNDDSGQFYGLGFSYDNLDWFLMGEYTVVEIADSFYPKETSSYISAGFRKGKFTPFVSIESQDLNNDLKFMDRALFLPEAQQQTALAIIRGVQQPFAFEQVSTTVGLRYDVKTGMALKLDATRTNDKIYETLDTTLIRAAVSYVF